MKQVYITIRHKATNKVTNVIKQESHEAAVEYCIKANSMFKYYNFSIES